MDLIWLEKDIYHFWDKVHTIDKDHQWGLRQLSIWYTLVYQLCVKEISMDCNTFFFDMQSGYWRITWVWDGIPLLYLGMLEWIGPVAIRNLFLMLVLFFPSKKRFLFLFFLILVYTWQGMRNRSRETLLLKIWSRELVTHRIFPLR